MPRDPPIIVAAMTTGQNLSADSSLIALDSGKPERIRRMFASIVPRYDTINTLMTLGLDRRWRRATVASVEPAGGVALDIATGTGELALELARAGARLTVGMDFCPEMVVAARHKLAGTERPAGIRLGVGDAMALPFPDRTFDCIVNGFMLRNVGDLGATFAELHRVLKPGGRLACLDLTPPRGPMRRMFSLISLRRCRCSEFWSDADTPPIAIFINRSASIPTPGRWRR